MILGFIFFAIIFFIVKSDFKKWEKTLLFSLITTIILLFTTAIMNNINETIWQISRTLFFAMITVNIGSVLVCLFLSIKNKEKLATWIKVILVISIIVGIISVVGQLSLNKETTVNRNELKTQKTYNQ